MAQMASAITLATSPEPTKAHGIRHEHNGVRHLTPVTNMGMRHKTSGHKFLLVLDDIWNDDHAKWIELIDFIKVDAIGSQITVTTRSNSIASMVGGVVKCSDLVEIGKEIVKKCAGVPLAVRTLGSSLFLKYDSKKWISLRDCEIWNFEQKKGDIFPALKLSYDQMSSYLRQCFAYFSLYLKDHDISIGEITRLWIALGLIQYQNGIEQLMDISREYIEELKSRSFLQDFENFGFVVTFKVHELIHDLAVYVRKEECVY
ncbi:unnamed protein product [Vicia faba]|uniref:NB-ARC domain-containing protein n=1 Tax=Vicia faba TaxID=3906 RepID=A0AAV1ATX8_VICFA|nr:unnamed protein product [Vicia faba]